MEQEVTCCGDVHELQLPLLLVFLDHLVASSNQDVVLLLLVEEDRHNDVVLVFVKLDSNECFEWHSPLQIFEVDGLAFFVSEACFHIHHPHKRTHNESPLVLEESVLLQHESMILIAVFNSSFGLFLKLER